MKASRGGKQGTATVKYGIEIVRRTNDRHLNSHWRPLLKAWQANIDLQLIVDSGKVVQYMTKYVTKTEVKSTKAVMRMMKKLLMSTAEDNFPPSRVLRKTMGKLFGERVISHQETCHLIFSIPLVSCSHNFVNLYLEGDSKEIAFSKLWSNDREGVNQSAGSGKSIKLFLVDVYAPRCDYSFWMNGELFIEVEQPLKQMPLNEFVRRYCDVTTAFG